MFVRYSLIILLFKDTIFSLLETRITSLFSSVTLRVVVGFLTLANQSYYVLEQLELFLIILSLESIDSTFFLQSILNIHVTIVR